MTTPSPTQFFVRKNEKTGRIEIQQGERWRQARGVTITVPTIVLEDGITFGHGRVRRLKNRYFRVDEA